MILYSPGTNAFYSAELSDSPNDAVEISDVQHKGLLIGQTQGKKIVPDESGYPVLVDIVYDFNTWLDMVVRPQRNARLIQSDIYMIADYPITEIKRNEWTIYRQALRDLPGSLTEVVDPLPWPVVPE